MCRDWRADSAVMSTGCSGEIPGLSLSTGTVTQPSVTPAPEGLTPSLWGSSPWSHHSSLACIWVHLIFIFLTRVFTKANRRMPKTFPNSLQTNFPPVNISHVSAPISYIISKIDTIYMIRDIKYVIYTNIVT